MLTGDWFNSLTSISLLACGSFRWRVLSKGISQLPPIAHARVYVCILCIHTSMQCMHMLSQLPCLRDCLLSTRFLLLSELYLSMAFFDNIRCHLRMHVCVYSLKHILYTVFSAHSPYLFCSRSSQTSISAKDSKVA